MELPQAQDRQRERKEQMEDVREVALGTFFGTLRRS